MQVPLSFEEGTKLHQVLMQLSPDDWKSIYNHILIPNNENITVNKGGVFFDLFTLSPKSIEQIRRHIKHIKNVSI